MKSFKIRVATFAFAVATLAGLLFPSCRKEEILPPPPETFTKEVTLTDREGKNTAVVRFSSESESLLEGVDLSSLFRIEPIFESPKGEFKDVSAPVEQQQSGPAINIEIVSQHLEAGAMGLNLVYDSKSDIGERWQYAFSFTTTYDHIRVTITVGCHTVNYYRKLYSYSPFVWLGGYSNRCAYYWSQGWSVPSYQMRAYVYCNAGTTFTVCFW